MNRLRAWVSRHRTLVVAIALGVVLVGYLGFHAVRAYLAWRELDRIAFDIPGSRGVLEDLTTTSAGTGDSTIPVVTVDPTLDAGMEAFLVIGSDERPNPIPGFVQNHLYGDAILLYLVPADASPALVSLPRDLLVTSPCTGAVVKINSLFAGCGTVSGAELLAVAVEDFTGIGIDHFAAVRFDGFVDVIDGLGGITLCVPHALRLNPTTDLLPAGCSLADGVTTLAFVQNRTTLELVDGEWRVQEGVSDLTRVRRQQDVLFALLARAKTLRTPGDLADLVSSLDDGAVVLDDTLEMGAAISLAWDLRGTPPGSIRRIVLPVEPTVTADGKYAVVATKTLLEVLGE